METLLEYLARWKKSTYPHNAEQTRRQFFFARGNHTERTQPFLYTRAFIALPLFSNSEVNMQPYEMWIAVEPHFDVFIVR